jgi:pyrroloquinoline-quinone synthase
MSAGPKDTQRAESERGQSNPNHADFEARLRRIGDERYHHRHPFNLRMHDGTLTREEIQTWVRNRYYYQTRIPIKDGLILSKAPGAGFRREWIRRIRDHDGDCGGEGGLELWLTLADAVAMGHLPIAGAEGSLVRLAEIPGRTLYIHMNNTNPILDADSPEAAEVARAGVEIASDGQEFEV